MSEFNLPVLKVNRRRLILVAAILAVILGAVFWLTRNFFAANYAQYLLNQRDAVAAMKYLEKLRPHRPTDKRLLGYEVQARTLLGQFQRATNLVQDARLSEFAPEVLYWLSVAEYQQGRTTASKALAREFLKTGEMLPNGANAVAMALAGETSLTDSPDLNSVPFRMMYSMEQGMYLAFVAEQQTRLENFQQATAMFREALIRGNRNASSMATAAFAATLTGDFRAARMFARFAGPKAVERVEERLRARHGQTGQPRILLQGGEQVAGGQQIDVARAMAWVLAIKTEPSGTTDAIRSLLQDFHDDASIKMSLADALMVAGEREHARELYAELQESNPSLEGWLRLHGEASAQPESIAGGTRSFLQTITGNSVQTLEKFESGEMEYRDGKREGPTLETQFTIHDGGSYGLVIVARAAKSSLRDSPEAGLAYVWINDEITGICDFPLQSWEVSLTKITLDAGKHSVKLTPVDGMSLPVVAVCAVLGSGI